MVEAKMEDLIWRRSTNCMGTALFSPDMKYRYYLWRQFDPKVPPRRLLNVIMLNPSTATESVGDPTVTRQERRAKSLGYDGLIVTNLFALRSSSPRALKVDADPVGGPNTDKFIYHGAIYAARSGGAIIVGWGNHGSYLQRSKTVLALLRARGFALHALAVTAAGEPGHPLYIQYDKQPFSFPL